MPRRYGTVPARNYVPAGQKPIALRCPPGEHAHGGYPYCHPADREHRVAHQELHEEQGRMQRVESLMSSLSGEMRDLAMSGQKVPMKMRQDFARLYTYVQRAKGTERKLPMNRAMHKDGGGGDGGGPGVGPLAPVDPLRGSDVHIDVGGGHGRRIKPSMHKAVCGFSVLNLKRCPPGEHRHGDFPCHPQERAHRRPKGMRCPPGQHKHDDFDCHSNQRKHRGLKKPGAEEGKPGSRQGILTYLRARDKKLEEERLAEEERRKREPAEEKLPGNPFGSPLSIKKKMNEVSQEIYAIQRNAPRSDHLTDRQEDEKNELREMYQKLREQWLDARRWQASPEGRAYANQKKIAQAKGQGNKSRDYYEAKAKELGVEKERLANEHTALWEKYREASATLRGYDQDDYARKDELRDKYSEAQQELAANTKQVNRVTAAIKRNKSYAGIGVAREWVDTIKTLTGGVEPQISAIRTGSRSYAHYSLDSGIIGISDQALELLRKVRDNPDLLFAEEKADSRGNKQGFNRYAYAVSALFHEFLHSVNPAKGAYRTGPLQWIEEGLTDAIANRMVARPEILGKLIGRDVDKGAIAKPGPKYAPWVDAMEYLAERAAKKHGTDPEWFLGKWKFHTPATVDRPEQMFEDADVTDEPGGWKEVFRGVREELPKLKEQRQAQRTAQQNKAFTTAVFGAWWNATPGFVVRGMVDSGRHTSSAEGDPPKGVGFQKFPRQIEAAEGLGGNGVAIREPVKPKCEGCGGVGGKGGRMR